MSVLQTVRYHIDRELQGVINWRDVVIVNNTGQMGVFEVNSSKGNKYELIVRSPSDAPPLGQVVLRLVHADDNKQDMINDLNRDRTWAMIAEFLRARESGESPDRAVAAAHAAAPETKPVAVREDRGYTIPSRSLVYFIAQKGEFYRDGFAIVTGETARDGVTLLDLTVFAKNHEHYQVERVAPRSDELLYHCYVDAFSPPAQLVRGDIAEGADMHSPGHITWLNQSPSSSLLDHIGALVTTAVAKLMPEALKTAIENLDQEFDGKLSKYDGVSFVAVAGAAAADQSGIHPAMLGQPKDEAEKIEGAQTDVSEARAALEEAFGQGAEWTPEQLAAMEARIEATAQGDAPDPKSDGESDRVTALDTLQQMLGTTEPAAETPAT